MEIDSPRHRREGFLHHVFKPCRSAVTQAARLAYDYGSVISIPCILKQIAQRPDAIISGTHRGMGTMFPVFHLTERVAVRPYDIEYLGVAPELRVSSA